MKIFFLASKDICSSFSCFFLIFLLNRCSSDFVKPADKIVFIIFQSQNDMKREAIPIERHVEVSLFEILFQAHVCIEYETNKMNG